MIGYNVNKPTRTTIRKGSDTMEIPRERTYTETDYYNLPEDVRAELIDGQLFYMSAPSRIHQEILSDLHGTIFNYALNKKMYHVVICCNLLYFT